MSAWKKIANANYEEESCWTTRSFNRHGLGRRLRRIKRVRNRAAKRLDARWHADSQ